MLNLSKYFENSFHSIYLFIFACECFICMHVYVPHAQLVPVEARIGIPGLELQTAEATM